MESCTFTGDFDSLQTNSEKGTIFYETLFQSVNALVRDAVVPEIDGFKRLCGFLSIFVLTISIIIVTILPKYFFALSECYNLFSTICKCFSMLHSCFSGN